MAALTAGREDAQAVIFVCSARDVANRLGDRRDAGGAVDPLGSGISRRDQHHVPLELIDKILQKKHATANILLGIADVGDAKRAAVSGRSCIGPRAPLSEFSQTPSFD